MSAADTKQLIRQAIERLVADVPAIGKLKLVIRLELAARGGDAPIWRVEVPGPKIERDPAGDARVNVIVQRQQFNTLAVEGGLREWARAYEKGHVKISGDSSVIKLMANVFERHLSRARG